MEPMPPKRDLRSWFVHRTRVASLIVAGLFATGLVLESLDYFDMTEGVGWAVVALLLINCLAELFVRIAPDPRVVNVGYQLGLLIGITVVIYLLEGIEFAAAPLFYVFVVSFAGLSRVLTFVIPNLCAALYATVLYLTPTDLHQMKPLERPELVAAVVTWVALNFLAFFIRGMARQLEERGDSLVEANRELKRYRESLELQVSERTRDLERVNAELDVRAQDSERRSERLHKNVFQVAHDLKQPVSSILLTADRLSGLRVIGEGEVARAHVEKIADLAARTEAMILQLLDAFAITAAAEEARSVDLGEVVDQVVKELGPQASARNVRVQVRELGYVWASQGKLMHVMGNLMHNAIKHVAGNGSGCIEVSGQRQDGHYELCVEDNGIGIAPEYHERIFDLFARVPAADRRVDGEEVEGTGLGLAIVRQIVEDHGGSVRVDSAPGSGSRFYVRLPAAGEGGTA